jgi:hypothetical protein
MRQCGATSGGGASALGANSAGAPIVVKNPDADSPGGWPSPERARPEAVSRLDPGTLPYVLRGDVGLRSSAGRPVTDESELEALRSTVELFDGRLEAMDLEWPLRRRASIS